MPDLARLRQALTLEAKHHHPNLKGREAHFADFVASELKKVLPRLPEAERRPLVVLQKQFERYAGLVPDARAEAVSALQRCLVDLEQPDAPGEPGTERDWRDRPVQFVKGIGPRVAEKLVKLNIHTVDDLLRHFPRQHLDFAKRVRIGSLRPGGHVTIWGTIKRVEAYVPPAKPNMSILTVWVSDGTGLVAARFFGKKANKFQLDRQKQRFPAGQTVLMSGEPKIDSFSGRIVFDRPETELLGDTEGAEGSSLHVGRIVPIYPLTEGLNLKLLRKAIRAALDAYLPLVRDALPAEMREAYGLVPLRKALEGIHFPRDQQALEAARHRLVFEELFWLQLGLAYRRAQANTAAEAVQVPGTGELVARFKARLPFALTGAQERVFKEILADMAAPRPMNRLVQGDVGSGKTVVALLALLTAVENGYQGAFMAPTEILAEQHFEKTHAWLAELGLKAALLVGKQGKKERHATIRAIEEGLVHVVVGTHALVQEKVAFKRLGMAVIDEQHRFGVRQRATLRDKGRSPEVLVMTATPIPRTLALTIHGDLDVSVIDELPPGRKPIATRWVRGARARKEVWELVRAQIGAGRQCYVVYPLIAESEKLDVKAATEEYERLRDAVFPEHRVALLHGQMRPDEKEAAILAFRRGETQVLVSTTVIEVGVDVPNASVMVIENAERFGLAQLHQLRGRVGRGAAQSFCYLLSDARGDQTAQRLGIMEKTNDGFVIAEQDLALRGPGEFLGTRQSGMPDLVLADLANDTEILETARKAALELIAADPALMRYGAMKAALFRYFQANLSFLEVG